MQRNRKKSSIRDEARPSTSARTKEENDLAYFVHDRVTLMRELFSILKPKEIKSITPECVRKLSIDNLEELCLEELLGISSKRLCAVLDGAQTPSDTESSSSDSSSSSQSDNSGLTSPAAAAGVIDLDSESNDESSKKKKKKKNKKKKKKHKRKSTEDATNSDAIVEAVSTPQKNTKKSTRSRRDYTKNKQNKENNKNATVNAAILNEIGGKSDATVSERIERGKGSSRAANRVGMTVLEILELQARARAIRAQLNKEKNEASQAQPSTSTNKDTQSKQEDSSDSDIVIKEEAADVVDLLSSSEEDDDDEKPKVEDIVVAAVKDPDPPPASKRDKDNQNNKKNKPANKATATITPEEATITIQPEETTTPVIANKSITPEKNNKRRQKDNHNITKRLKTGNDYETEVNNLPNTTEQLPNSKNSVPNTETPQVITDTELIKQEDLELESSPVLILLEDSDNEITTHVGNKQQPENPQSPESNEDSVQSIVKVIDAQKTNESRKSNCKNDFTITVTENSQRKVRKDQNNVVISFSNVANTKEPERVCTSIYASTQKKDLSDKNSDIIEHSAIKLNSTVTKIIKERSQRKYIKSVVHKTGDKDRPTRTSRKEITSSDNKNTSKDKDQESDGDEITLQLSDSEKMDLLEDLNPKTLNKITENTGSDSKSSENDDSGSCSDDTERSDKQGVGVTELTRDANIKIDVNQEADNENYSSRKENDKITKNYHNTDTTKQDGDAAIDSVTHESSSKTMGTASELTIPKTIVNDIENEPNQPVKTIISHLRVDKVLDAPKKSTNKCFSENNEDLSNTLNTDKESSFTEIDGVSSNKPCGSNLTNENSPNKGKINLSQSKDLNTVYNQSNLNVLKIRSISDIPILPDNDGDIEPSLPKDTNTNLDKEAVIVKDIFLQKTKSKLKKKRNKLNRDRGYSLSDDVVESNVIRVDVGLKKDTEKEIIKEIIIDDTKSITKTSRLDFSEQTSEKDTIIHRTDILQKDNTINNLTKEQTVLKTSDLLLETLTNSPDSVTKDCHTHYNELEIEEIPKETNANCKQTETYSIPLEINHGACTSDDGNKIRDGHGEIKTCISVDKSNKMAADHGSGAKQDGAETEVMALETSETPKNNESKDVVEQADLEEGEITDDYRRQVSEEGEITTDTESEIEAQDVVSETICISDEEICSRENLDDITKDNADVSSETNKTKKKHLCKKCKRKKASQKNPDQNFYRNSFRENKLIKNVKVRTNNELPTDINQSDISTLCNDIPQVTKGSNNYIKELEIDNISLDSDPDSDSDSNSINSNKVKIQSQNLINDNFKPIDENVSNTDLLLPNINLTDSDTLETLEISDDSSDCYEILSKEPTTEEIEALSEKIDSIDRIEVVTKEEIIQHEKSNRTNEELSCDKNNDTGWKYYENSIESQNPNENHTETIPDENISWMDRYVKSKKVTKVLTTSNILNALRKKNLDLKKKLLESKMAKTVEEVKETVEEVPETVEVGSIEHYNTLESSTKYVDPVQESTIPETETKDTNLTTIDKTATETQIVTKEMKKDAKQLYKMYKKLIKYNNMYKEKDPNKKKKKKKKKNKDGDTSCSSGVTDNVLTTNC